MSKDFPVEFRENDLISSWESLQHYRMQESLIDDEVSDAEYSRIKRDVMFYETRITQIKAQLDWFGFMDAETTPIDDSWQASLIATPQSKIDTLLNKALTYRMFNISPYSFGKSPSDYNNRRANEFEWLAFMEAN